MVMSNDELNNLKLRQLFLNALLGNGYGPEEQARLQADKEATDKALLDEERN